jgi:hypothetical protein
MYRRDIPVPVDTASLYENESADVKPIRFELDTIHQHLEKLAYAINIAISITEPIRFVREEKTTPADDNRPSLISSTGSDMQMELSRINRTLLELTQRVMYIVETSQI